MAWTGTGGLGDVGEIYRWKGGWIAQTRASVDNGAATFWVSADGRTWRRVVSSLQKATLEAVSGENLLADSTPGHVFWTSTDGINWRQLNAKGLDEIDWYSASIVGGPAGYVAAVWGAFVGGTYGSADGKVWSRVSIPNLIETYFVTYAKSRYLLFGREKQDRDEQSRVWWSTDGRAWSLAQPAGDGITGNWKGLAVGRDGLLASADLAWYTSRDALKWPYGKSIFYPVGETHSIGDPGFPCANGIVSGNGDQIVAYKWDGSAWASSDGENWTQLAIPRLPEMAAWATASANCKTPAITLRVLPRGIQLGDHYGAAG